MPRKSLPGRPLGSESPRLPYSDVRVDVRTETGLPTCNILAAYSATSGKASLGLACDRFRMSEYAAPRVAADGPGEFEASTDVGQIELPGTVDVRRGQEAVSGDRQRREIWGKRRCVSFRLEESRRATWSFPPRSSGREPARMRIARRA